jgi:hypothetical protein
MKTSIKTIIALALTTAVISGTTLAAKANDNQITVLSETKKIDKINVAGNVEVILVQSANESVKVYDNYYSKNALVQQQNGELRISSFDKKPLTVVVYVASLSSITASNNATVKTNGVFNTLGLDVTLNDKASAHLNTNTVNLFTKVNGQANLTLTGSTEDYYAVMGSVAKLNMAQFSALSTNIQSQNVALATIATTLNSLPTGDELYNL